MNDAQLETFWKIQDLDGAVIGPGVLQGPEGPVEVREGERAMVVNGIVLRYSDNALPINDEQLYQNQEVVVELRLPDNMGAQGIVLEVRRKSYGLHTIAPITLNHCRHHFRSTPDAWKDWCTTD